MQQVASFVLPLLLLLLLLLALTPGRAVALLVCTANVSLWAPEDSVTIYDESLSGEEIIRLGKHRTSLYLHPLSGFKGLSTRLLSVDGGLLGTAWFPLEGACFTSIAQWWELRFVVYEYSNHTGEVTLAVSAGSCSDACTLKLSNNIQSCERVRLRAHGASRWMVRKPANECGSVQLNIAHVSKGPHLPCRNPAAMEEQCGATTLGHGTTSPAPPTPAAASETAPGSGERLTTVLVVVVVLQVVLVVLVSVLVVVTMRRNLRPLTATVG